MMIAQFFIALALVLGPASSGLQDECDVDLYVEVKAPGAVIVVHGVEYYPGFGGVHVLERASLDGRYDVSGFEIDGDWVRKGPLFMKKTGVYGCYGLSRWSADDAILDARGSSGTILY